VVGSRSSIAKFPIKISVFWLGVWERKHLDFLRWDEILVTTYVEHGSLAWIYISDV